MNQSQNNLIRADEKAPERDLEVNVVFTTTKGTLTALRMAGKTRG